MKDRVVETLEEFLQAAFLDNTMTDDQFHSCCFLLSVGTVETNNTTHDTQPISKWFVPLTIL